MLPIERKTARELLSKRRNGFQVSTEDIPKSYMFEKDVFLKITYNSGISVMNLPLTKSEAIQVIDILKKEFGL